MEAGKLIVVVVAIVAVGVARFVINPGPPDNKAWQEESNRRAAEAKERQLSESCNILLTSIHRDFAVNLPGRATRAHFVIMGRDDDDWSLSWQYDTHFAVLRSYVTDRLKPVDPPAEFQRLKEVANGYVKRHNKEWAGKPEGWIVQGERDFTIDGKWFAHELTYTFKKFTTHDDRLGRICTIKIPNAIITLKVNGEPDVVNSPLVNSFFQSFACVPVER